MSANAIQTTELLDAALGYADKGLPVFPCNPNNKRPLTAHGFKDASAEEKTVKNWWAKWPDAMIGIPTGRASNCWVLDVDDPAAFEAACKIELPETRRVETGKGYHLYWLHDPDAQIGNRQKDKSGWPFPSLPGAETRGDGGYVIVPPSIHPTGRKYEWAGDASAVPAPNALVQLIKAKRRPQQKRSSPANDSGTKRHLGGGTAYGLAALNAECEAIRAAGYEEQEGTLSWAARQIGGLVKGGEVDEAFARSALIDAAKDMHSFNPKDPWTPEEIEKKVRNRMAAGEPRSAPNSSETNSSEPSRQPSFSENPVDLWRHYSAPELPKDLLPGPIEAFARSHSQTMGVDPAGLAMACLCVCGSVISDAIRLQVKRHDPTWTESARLWVGLVGSPSMKKSPIINAATRPLKRIDKNLMRAYTENRQTYDALTPAERKNVDRPKQERRIISDSTIEAAQEVLKDSPRGVLSLQDELSGWFGTMDKYAPGKGAQADRGFWLQAYNGGSYSLNRIGRGASYIPNCSISLLGGVQPEPIRAIAGDTHDDGIVQRLIPVVLRRGQVGRDEPCDATLFDYERLIEALEVLQPSERSGAISYSDESHPPLKLDHGARAIREEMEVEHLELAQSLEGVSPKMAAHFGKHDGLFARLCVVWHCVEHNSGGRVPEAVSERTASRVARFMRQFLRPSAVAFYAGLLGMSAGHDKLVDLASWIVAEKLESITPRDVQRSGQKFKHVTADEVRGLCEKLEAFGWGEWGEPGPKSNRPPFIVNPRVHELFEEQGAAETQRRAKARMLIAEAVGG